MSSSQIPVGALHCQTDTYSRECITECIECSDSVDKEGYYHVRLRDTVIFPEGGGQPSDTGKIDSVQVYKVERKKLAHVHYTKEPVPAQQQVKVTVDWERRWDHVQQHSGQHLLSAVLEKEPYELPTVSWNLGPTKSYIELGTKGRKAPTQEQLDQVESQVNALIFKDLPVTCRVEQNNDTSSSSTLPEDYVGGYIRTICIEGIDDNTCCGTHVRALGHLQSLKLLHTESSRGGNTRLFFVFGQRVLDTLHTSYQISRQLTQVLSVPQEQFVESVQRSQLQTRTANKQIKQLLSLLADHTATLVKTQLEAQAYAFVYHPEGDIDFLTRIATRLEEAQALSVPGRVVVLIAGEETAGGPILIAGGDSLIQKAVQVLTPHIDQLKGGGKRRWQGKAKSWKKVESLQRVLAAAVTSSPPTASSLSL
ncbi:Threonyl/alanyl tRNA synthetase [Spinellus fusiger]|nr:Threonyl/alanyl tRNA synthetase [Spinellus fusiger]